MNILINFNVCDAFNYVGIKILVRVLRRTRFIFIKNFCVNNVGVRTAICQLTFLFVRRNVLRWPAKKFDGLLRFLGLILNEVHPRPICQRTFQCVDYEGKRWQMWFCVSKQPLFIKICITRMTFRRKCNTCGE